MKYYQPSADRAKRPHIRIAQSSSEICRNVLELPSIQKLGIGYHTELSEQSSCFLCQNLEISFNTTLLKSFPTLSPTHNVWWNVTSLQIGQEEIFIMLLSRFLLTFVQTFHVPKQNLDILFYTTEFYFNKQNLDKCSILLNSILVFPNYTSCYPYCILRDLLQI